ncbi:hypothetical protein BGZ83_007491 [Gryganskiella cystojenkinii]|nr:hypothetical protein BGZ83_007491 [Gryganskiella cystojenkinii]
MGWFSRSSSTNATSETTKDDHSSADQQPTSSKQQSPEKENTSNEGLHNKTSPEPTATPASTQTQQPHTETQRERPVQTYTYGGDPLPLRFDEYEEPEDVFARFKVGDAMNHLAACSSLGSNIRNYYRFGTFRDCGDKYDHLKFCLSIKTKSSQVAQVMIQKRDAELRAKKAAQPNSEDVWTKRTHPPEELVNLARQGQQH